MRRAASLPARYAFLAALLALMPMGACSCDEDQLTEITPGTCEPGFGCGQGQTYRRGQCAPVRCQDDTGCCPGERCSVQIGACVSQLVACTADSDCVAIPGQSCLALRDGQYCGYPNASLESTASQTYACDSDADCPAASACMGQRCVVSAPCEGGCSNGQVCDIDTNTCFDLPSCTATCEQGQMLVVADPDGMTQDMCCAVECACATLPPVAVGSYGWHASLVAQTDGAHVSAYDAQYGDLVVASYDTSGTFTRIDYVDGYPDTGPVVANPNGRRGGREAVGDDVGEYTSIAADSAGNLHVAYYDRTNGALRYAVRQAGVWTSHEVDTDGDAGRYTSIAVGSDGRPRIAYMVVSATDGTGAAIAGLRYAEAGSAAPAASGDWSVTLVDSTPLGTTACGGSCPRDQVCADAGNGPSCLSESTGCSPACTGNQACVGLPSGATCLAEVPTLAFDDLPPGTGLFSSLVLDASDAAMIAYYDHDAGDLRLARQTASGFSTETLDGTDADVGAHVSAALTPDGALALAYMDMTRDDLVYLVPSQNLREVIDDGVTPPDLRMVGADASLSYRADGFASVAYQDGTNLDLKLAVRGGPTQWTSEIVRGGIPAGATQGTAAGFYATHGIASGRTYIGSVAVGFDATGNLQLSLTVDTRN